MVWKPLWLPKESWQEACTASEGQAETVAVDLRTLAAGTVAVDCFVEVGTAVAPEHQAVVGSQGGPGNLWASAPQADLAAASRLVEAAHLQVRNSLAVQRYPLATKVHTSNEEMGMTGPTG